MQEFNYNNKNKEWYEKNEILEIYPIGVTTYKKRIKILSEPNYSGATRIISRRLTNSNLGFIKVRQIHFSILDRLFKRLRTPTQKDSVIKWVNNCKWDWFGNVIPSKSYPVELISKMKFLFSQLKKRAKKEGQLALFYSIEKNTKDDYYHSHFLINTTGCGIMETDINECLLLITEEKTSKESRLHLEKYNYEFYGQRGINYLQKEFRFGYGILK